VAIEVTDLVKTYGRGPKAVPALDGVSFAVPAGAVVALLGPNGAGKSTTVKILAGDYRRDAGRIFVNGEEVKLDTPAEAGAVGVKVIFQEFKGTGNMELVLSRDLADRRIWPAIDITLSGTRREELILEPEVLDGVTMLRRSLISLNPIEAMEQLVRTLERFPTNAEFLTKIRSIL
jgi:ABC-type branched-subunit amino acid transport system ATPase component